MFIDCHTHILYGIDDGAKTAEESFEMIDEEVANGAVCIWLTPHFNAKRGDSLESFKALRRTAYNTIVKKYDEIDVTFVSGAEVMLCDELFDATDLDSLCINGGENILVEFNYGCSVTDIKRLLSKLIYSYGKTPIIAHIERFKQLFYSNKEISALIAMGCKLQMNVQILESSILDSLMAYKRIQKNEITLLGTDCHNLTLRTPDFQKGINNLKNVFGHKAVDRLNENAMEIIEIKQEKRCLFN